MLPWDAALGAQPHTQGLGTLPNVGLLDAFEAKIDSLVNGAFARAFNAEVQPVELAAALQREMDDRAATLDAHRTITVNYFEIDLAPRDHERLAPHLQTLASELSTLVKEHAAAQQLTLMGPVAMSFTEDADLDTGVFRVRSKSRQAPGAAMSGGPRLVLADGQQIPLVRTVTQLGRSKEANIHIDDVGASRAHCEIVLGDVIKVRDLGSTNGTYVDGSRVAEADLIDGSRITLGSTTLTLRTM